MRLSKSKIEILPAINVKRVAPKNLRPGDEKFFNRSQGPRNHTIAQRAV